MFLGYGGAILNPVCSAECKFRCRCQRPEMMKALSEYMNLTFSPMTVTQPTLNSALAMFAIMNMWGSRAATLVDVDGVSAEVKNGMNIAGPMTVGGGSTPASTLWWDGWTVAKNVSDAEAEATFIAMMNGIDPSIIKDEDIRKQAVWAD